MEKQLRVLSFPLLIFLICFTVVATNNRFASDDFEFLNKLRDYGWLESVKWFHQHWNTRWSAIAVLNSVLLVSLQLNSLLWYHLLSLFLLWLGAFRLITNFSGSEGKLNALKAGYFSIAFFYACFSNSDVFFWINTSTMYLLGSVALLFAAAEITAPQHTVGSYLRLVMFSVFMGGAYEPLVFTCMLSAILVLGMLIKKHRWKVWLFPFDKKIIIFLSGLMVGFAISYSGEGHVVRASFLPDTTLGFKTWVWIKAIVKIFVLYLPQIIPAFLLGCIPWILFPLKINFSTTRRQFILITICYLLLVITSLLPVAFVMSEMGPARSWTQISLYTVVYAAFAGIYLGNIIRKNYSIQQTTIVLFAFAMIYISVTGIVASYKSFQYSKAYDDRMLKIRSAKERGQVQELILTPLPQQGWLHSAELDVNPEYFTNQFLKEYLQLPFDVRKENTLE